MSVRAAVIVSAILLQTLGADAIVFGRCGLVRELRRQRFPEHSLRNWVCLVEAESSRNTAAVGRNNGDGSFDSGLFQINSRYWCGIFQIGGECNMRCSDLTDDDITDDSRCAKLIYQRHGFYGWVGWQRKCQNKRLPYIGNC